MRASKKIYHKKEKIDFERFTRRHVRGLLEVYHQVAKIEIKWLVVFSFSPQRKLHWSRFAFAATPQETAHGPSDGLSQNNSDYQIKKV